MCPALAPHWTRVSSPFLPRLLPKIPVLTALGAFLQGWSFKGWGARARSQ